MTDNQPRPEIDGLYRSLARHAVTPNIDLVVRRAHRRRNQRRLRWAGAGVIALAGITVPLAMLGVASPPDHAASIAQSPTTPSLTFSPPAITAPSPSHGQAGLTELVGSVPVDGPVLSDVTVGDTVYFLGPSSSGHPSIFAVRDGHVVAQRSVNPGAGSLTAASGHLWLGVGGQDKFGNPASGGSIVLLDARTLSPVTTIPSTGPVQYLTLAGARVIAASQHSKTSWTIEAYDVTRMSEVATQSVSGFVVGLAGARNGSIYVTEAQGGGSAITVLDPHLRKSAATRLTGQATIAVADRALQALVTDPSGQRSRVLSLDPVSLLVTRTTVLDHPLPAGAIVVDHGTAWLSSSATQNLACLVLGTGHIAWQTATPWGVVGLGPDATVVVTDNQQLQVRAPTAACTQGP